MSEGTDIVNVAQVAMMAHSASVATQTEIRVHREECAATRLRNEAIFSDIRQTIRSLDNKMDDSASDLATKMDIKHEELKKEVSASNKWLYLIIGGITVVGVLINKSSLSFHF